MNFKNRSGGNIKVTAWLLNCTAVKDKNLSPACKCALL